MRRRRHIEVRPRKERIKLPAIALLRYLALAKVLAGRGLPHIPVAAPTPGQPLRLFRKQMLSQPQGVGLECALSTGDQVAGELSLRGCGNGLGGSQDLLLEHGQVVILSQDLAQFGRHPPVRFQQPRADFAQQVGVVPVVLDAFPPLVQVLAAAVVGGGAVARRALR